jgi:hypothetical protein
MVLASFILQLMTIDCTFQNRMHYQNSQKYFYSINKYLLRSSPSIQEELGQKIFLPLCNWEKRNSNVINRQVYTDPYLMGFKV